MSKGTIGTSMVVFTPNKEKKPTLNELKAKLNKTKDKKQKKKLSNKIRRIKQKIKAANKRIQRYTTTCSTFYPDRVRRTINMFGKDREVGPRPADMTNKEWNAYLDFLEAETNQEPCNEQNPNKEIQDTYFQL